jgi:8-oxo-dGTP pyrophosphatase MutT (NUDIX family)
MNDRRRRESARLVMLDEHDRIFLFRHQDRLRTYWVTPGGGVEPGESWEEAALRELGEETGISGVPLDGWIWSREKDGLIGNEPVRAVERYYLVRAEPEMVHTRNQLAYEREVYQQYRWWSVDELRTSNETAYPAGLADLLERLIDEGVPVKPMSLPAEAED